jgi:hypothetical protein
MSNAAQNGIRTTMSRPERVALDVFRDKIEEQANIDRLVRTARIIGAQGAVEEYLSAEQDPQPSGPDIIQPRMDGR